MENEDEDSRRTRLKVHGTNFSENSAQDEQLYSSNIQLIPKDVLVYIITFYPYPWLSISRYFRSISLQVLPLDDKYKAVQHCCRQGYLDLLNQITVKFGQFMSDIIRWILVWIRPLITIEQSDLHY